jgi:hypothetical protein
VFGLGRRGGPDLDGRYGSRPTVRRAWLSGDGAAPGGQRRLAALIDPLDLGRASKEEHVVVADGEGALAPLECAAEPQFPALRSAVHWATWFIRKAATLGAA